MITNTMLGTATRHELVDPINGFGPNQSAGRILCRQGRLKVEIFGTAERILRL
jgi:hypothetical protein